MSVRKIHVAEPNITDGVDVVVALCGAVGTILPDGSLHPDDYDFIAPEWSENCTCAECITKLKQVVKSRGAVRCPG
jgi:hypothetical protein